VQKIHQSGKHLLGIINDILDFSKIEAGKLTVEKIDFSLQSVLDNVLTLVAEKAHAEGVPCASTADQGSAGLPGRVARPDGCRCTTCTGKLHWIHHSRTSFFSQNQTSAFLERCGEEVGSRADGWTPGTQTHSLVAVL
jgi:hypothetical protein